MSSSQIFGAFSRLLGATCATLLFFFPRPGISQTAGAAHPGCRVDTLEHVIAQSRADLAMGSAKVLGTGILLFAARNGPPLVKWGSAIALLVDVPGFAKALSDANQTKGTGAKNPDSSVEICPVDDLVARSFHFEHMEVINIKRSLPQSPPSSAGLKLLDKWPLLPPSPTASIDDWLKKNKSELSPGLAEIKTLAPLQPIRAESFGSTITAVAPATVGRLSAPVQPGSVAGTVVDMETGSRINKAWIRLTAAGGEAMGSWQETRTWADGKFAFQARSEEYVLSVEIPGYRPYSTSIKLTPGVTKDLPVAVHRMGPYPCDVTVFNKTGGRITLLFHDLGTSVDVAPWASKTILVDSPVRMEPVAASHQWHKYRLHCEGPGSLVLE